MSRVIICLTALLLVTAGVYSRVDARVGSGGDGGYTVVIDPGHGGADNGVVGRDGLMEKAVVLKLAKAVAAMLGDGYRVILTRDDDYDVDLYDRTAMANHHGADVFVSLHAGAGWGLHAGDAGLFYFSPSSGSVSGDRPAVDPPSGMSSEAVPWAMVQQRHVGESRGLAEALCRSFGEMRESVRCRIAGAPLAVLSGADMPAVAVETGSLTHPAWEKLITDDNFVIALAGRLASGIEDYLGRKR